jgi:hypothetical protein
MYYTGVFFATLFAFLSLLSTLATAAAAAAAEEEEELIKQPEEYQQRLVDWIRNAPSGNGYFHPAVQWKRLGSDGKSGSYAMHTLKDIKKGTPLLVVPREYVIDSFQNYDECTTVARMINEYENNNSNKAMENNKKNESLFAPYLSYLFDNNNEGGTSIGLLPTSWSVQGQQILEDLLDIGGNNNEIGPGLEPRQYEHSSVFEVCGPNFRSDEHGKPLQDKRRRQRAEDAHLFYVSRSWQDKMVPVLDMFNHRNGKWLNVESTSAHDLQNDITAYALRDIKAGEQLQNTYSECMDKDCEYGEIKYVYLTQSIFKDYGFVELYPRRWRLGSARYDKNIEPIDNKQGLIGEIDEEVDDDGVTIKTFKWVFDTPNEESIQWIEDKLNRLTKIESNVRNDIDKHRRQKQTIEKDYNTRDVIFNIDHEVDSLLELYEGYIEVLQLAIKHQNDPVSITKIEHYKELQAAWDLMDGDEL